MNKKIYILLTLGLVYLPLTQAIDTVTANLLKNVDLEKVINALHYEAINLRGKTAQDISYKIHQLLAGIPNEITGINLTNLKNNRIDAQFAEKIKAVLPQAYALTQKLKPFFENPKQALVVFSIILNAAGDAFPQSVKNLYGTLLTEASTLINSNKEKDVQAVKAAQYIFRRGAAIIEDLYNNRINLVNYDLTSDLSLLSTALIANFKAIQDAIETHLPAIQKIFDEARKIKKDDVINLEKIVMQELKKNGIL